MDLFRRIFGKSTEEASIDTPVSTRTEDLAPSGEKDSGEASQQVIDELDPTTIPVGTRDLPAVADGVTQPLSPESLIAHRTDHIEFGQASDVGLVRNNNQDAALSFLYTSRSVDDHPDFGLFMIADGMGGHHDGEKASAITTRMVAKQITTKIYLPMLANDDEASNVPLTEALIEAIQKANREVITKVPEGGTTATAVIVLGDLLHIAHVGDSRAYIITESGVEQITRDHSLVQRLIELGHITEEEAADHPQKNVLYRALGQNESLEVDTATRRMPPHSQLLICSDGLWGLVEKKDLYEIVMNATDPQQACDKLVALANTHGGIDNISAIVLKIY